MHDFDDGSVKSRTVVFLYDQVALVVIDVGAFVLTRAPESLNP